MPKIKKSNLASVKTIEPETYLLCDKCSNPNEVLYRKSDSRQFLCAECFLFKFKNKIVIL